MLSERQIVEQVERLTIRRLRLWVRQGWIAPKATTAGPTFDEIDVARARLICELRHDLNVNEDAIPVVLSLLDQLHGARRQLRSLAEAIERQPQSVRSALASHLSGSAGAPRER